MDFLADLVFELVGEAIVSLGIRALYAVGCSVTDIGINDLQTLFSRHPLG